MPRVPSLGARLDALPSSTFSDFGERLRREQEAGTLIPLHIGDTFAMPPAAAQAIDLGAASIHRYGPVTGSEPLRTAIAQRLLPELGLQATSAEICITGGATGGLLLCAAAVCDPGDEVVVLTPSWPLVFGILPTVGARPVMVAVGDDGWLDPDPEHLRRSLEAALTPATTAIYLSDPNNPSGFVYSRAHRRVIADVARRHDLWIWHDAVYAQLHWSKEPVRWGLDRATTERLLTVGSFSKSHALAGHRVGWVSFPRALAPGMSRLITHTSYHTGMGAQAMALAALDDPTYIERMRDSYRQGANAATATLRGRFHPPDGGGFVFLDLRGDGRAANELLVAFLDRHIALAPGRVFGTGFEGFARLCCTNIPPDELRLACEVINDVLGV